MKAALFFVLGMIVPITFFAQEVDQAELKEYFLDAEYFFAQEEYPDALNDYLELYNNGFKENANINYRIGICYLNIPGQKAKSIGYLLEAIKGISSKYKVSSIKQQNAPVDAYLFLGNAYRVNNQLNNAIEAYKKYKELAESAVEIDFADQQIMACNKAISFMENPLKIRMTNLGDSVNGPSSNFKAVISGDGKTLVYMNELPFYDAVYASKYLPDGWSTPVNITPQIQSDGDQYVTSISYDGTQLYLTKEDAFNSDIYTSKYNNEQWSKSQPIIGQDINTKYWESHASISKDGKTLFFTSNRKNGFGEMDIYKSQLQPNGLWGQPINLGKVINTEFNEDTPFITENDSVLYFSSQGHENMGGYDVFVSHLGKNGQWLPPENLKYPINTTDDDIFFYPWHNARIIYLSRIEDGGYGKEDIYAIQPADDKPLSELLAEFNKEEEQVVPSLAEVVKDTTTKEIIFEPTEQPAEDVKEKVIIEPPLDVQQKEQIIKEEPKIVQPPKEVELTPVYFAFDRYQLNQSGIDELKKVYNLMIDFPAVQVKLIGNTDAIGSAEYNLALSEKRAVAVFKYLVSMGIESKRLSTLGLGENNFAAINSNPDRTDNPEGRRLNRRVEFEITGTDPNLIVIRMASIPESLMFRK
jgi:outer membrane protein OmpA-like peptidoglycan-associated protein